MSFYHSLVKIEPKRSMRSSANPHPLTTQVRGSSATNTGNPVSSAINRSKSLSNAPPPVSIIPRSAMSAPNSGGVCSSAFLTAETILFNGSVKASKISLEDMVNDAHQTIDEIVRGSNHPLSIVIVGVGDADF